MKGKKLLALALCAVMVICLMPASAFAAGESEQPQEITNEKDDTIYNSGDIVYNNEGVVYNNTGIVYNNGGTVYNNGGTAYNNGGIVYNNGGTVYNNDGTVYNNEGVVYSHGGTVVEADGAEAFAPEKNTTEALAAPTFSRESGSYGSNFKVELSAADGAQIYYTLDGSEPSEDSTKYVESIPVEGSTVICAVAIAKGMEQSNIAMVAYALPTLTIPSFDAVNEGYKQPKAKSLVVENPGAVDAVITGIELDGENPEVFELSTTDGATVPAGETDDTTWTIRPIKGLEAGAYAARLKITFDSGDSTVTFLSFKVK